MLSSIEAGQLIVREQNRQWHFGNDDSLHVELVILDPGAYQKILFGGSIGAGESYKRLKNESTPLISATR
ncbi:MAG: hypothetical protein CSA34_06400 [Desulfobulbus propionicus]|nr:MAG: hypothetical protein CSA34_06400 [Desulfobulbus propionicus]